MIVFSTRSCSATWHAGGPRDVFTRCPPRDVELLIGFAQLRNVWAVHKPLRSLVHSFHQIPKPSVFHGKILNIWIWNAIDIYIYITYISHITLQDTFDTLKQRHNDCRISTFASLLLCKKLKCRPCCKFVLWKSNNKDKVEETFFALRSRHHHSMWSLATCPWMTGQLSWTWASRAMPLEEAWNEYPNQVLINYHWLRKERCDQLFSIMNPGY